ncbi:MAG: TonB-dependent receptor [Verrucomicrobiota bacterium]
MVSIAQNGGIRGSITDADFGDPVPGASIVVFPGGASIESDGDGNFFLQGLEPATYDLTIQRAGFVAERVAGVAVLPGGIADINVRMTIQVITLPEVVAAIPEEDEEEAQEILSFGAIQTDIDTIVTGLGEEAISKLGASDASGLLSKVSGANVVGGKTVVIRGLADRYNTITLNGLTIPSSDPDSRSVNIDIFPSKLIGGLAVSKTYVPTLPGESSGGNVDISLKSIPDEDFFDISIGTTYNTQATENPEFLADRTGLGTGFLGTADQRGLSKFAQDVTPTSLSTGNILDEDGNVVGRLSAQERLDLRAQLFNEIGDYGITTKTPPVDFSFSAVAGKKLEFFGKPAGVIGGVTYAKKYEHDPVSQSGALATNSLARIAQMDRRSSEELLAGVLLSGGVEYGENSFVNATYFSNVAAEAQARFGFAQFEAEGTIPIGDVSFPFLPSDLSEVLYRERSGYRERRLTTYQLNGEHFFDESDEDGGKFKWGMAYSDSSQTETGLREISYIIDPAGRVTIPGGTVLGFGDSASPIVFRDSEDSNYTINGVFDVPLYRTGPEEDTRVKIGGSFDRFTREFRQDVFQTERFNFPNGTAAFTNPDDTTGATPADVVLTSLQNPPFANRPVAFQVNRNPYIERFQGVNLYSAVQNTVAGHIQFDADVTKKLNVQFGARVETTDIRITSGLSENQITDLANPPGVLLVDVNRLDPTTTRPTLTSINRADLPDLIRNTELQRTDLLPMVGSTVELNDKMRLRGNWSRTIARPSFKELALVVSFFDPGVGGDTFRGNPGLGLSAISNYDMRWEWDPSPENSVGIGAFSKFIDSPIELINAGTFFSYRNEESGVVYGFEVDGNMGLGQFSPLLRKFDVSGNYTFIASAVEFGEVTTGIIDAGGFETSRRLQGQPEYIFNLNLTYDDEEESGIFMGLFLNVVGELLVSRGSVDQNGNQAFDIFQNPTTALDFTVSKKLVENWKLTFRARNLLNDIDFNTVGNTGFPDELTRSGIDYSVGFSGTWP